jgi:3-oxosteroid 1-dehydrogenase
MRTETVDVLAVGAGPGGLIAGLVARAQGRTPLVIEKSEWVGGTSSQSFGGLWFADNPLMREIGQTDSIEDGLTYLEHVVGDAGPAATRERQEAYLRTGLRMLEFWSSAGAGSSGSPAIPTTTRRSRAGGRPAGCSTRRCSTPAGWVPGGTGCARAGRCPVGW